MALFSIKDYIKNTSPGFSQIEMHHNFIPFENLMHQLINKNGFIAGSWPSLLLGGVKRANDLDIFLFRVDDFKRKLLRDGYLNFASIECGLNHEFKSQTSVYSSNFFVSLNEFCDVCFPPGNSVLYRKRRRRRKLNLILLEKVLDMGYFDSIKTIISNFPMNLTKNAVFYCDPRFIACSIKDEYYNKTVFQFDHVTRVDNDDNNNNNNNCLAKFVAKHVNNSKNDVLFNKYHPLSLHKLCLNIILNKIRL